MLFGLLYEKAAGVMVVGGCTGLVPLLLWRETWLLELKHFHFFNPWLWKIPKQPKSIKLVYNHFIETSIIQELANWLRELWYFDLVGLNSRDRGKNPHFTMWPDPLVDQQGISSVYFTLSGIGRSVRTWKDFKVGLCNEDKRTQTNLTRVEATRSLGGGGWLDFFPLTFVTIIAIKILFNMRWLVFKIQ